MKKLIIERLTEIEEKHEIKILYACESGSRAWGFPSKDSDYDVRFIYVHKMEWYLSIDKKKDDITDVGKVLDFGGWELRKALTLFSGSNCSLFEKLQSPVVYRELDGFRESLWSLKDVCFNPISGIYHYKAQANNLFDLDSDHVRLKKYLYVIRGTLAMEWIATYKETPPMELKDLRVLIADEEIGHWLDEVIKLKAEAGEDLHVERNSKIDAWIKETHSKREETVKEMRFKSAKPIEELNEILRRWIYHT